KMAKYLKTILLIFLIAGNNVQAYDSVFLSKNDPAPYEGLLFNIKDANKLRIELIEKDTFKTLNDSYERSLKLLDGNLKLKDEQIDLLVNRNIDLTKSLNSQKSMNNYE